MGAEEVQQEAPVVEATPSAADCEDLAKAKEACLAEGGDCSALMAGYLKCMEALKGEEAWTSSSSSNQCKYSSQMFALGSPTSANIHPDFNVSTRSSIAIYMQTISNKYCVL